MGMQSKFIVADPFGVGSDPDDRRLGRPQRNSSQPSPSRQPTGGFGTEHLNEKAMSDLNDQSFIPVYRPDLTGNERRYVLECVDSTWISSSGAFIDRFEQSCAVALKARHAIAVSNGTVALHLALHCLDIGPGDEVIVPTFTYIASVNAIRQTGATPVFAECRRDDWQIDPEDAERRITPRTKAIMPVHLYGAVCDMTRLMQIAERHGIHLLEDSAEAFGSTYNGRAAGTFGKAATFSFYGNKTITTGEGGLVVTNDDALADRIRRVKGQGQSPTRRYWHVELGFNYRMTNICAAIGLAQIERLDAILSHKRELARIYRYKLANLPVQVQRPAAPVLSSEWLFSLLLPSNVDRSATMEAMARKGIETRPVFYCAHQMPMYEMAERFPISEEISARGISLPSYPALSEADQDRVISALRSTL